MRLDYSVRKFQTERMEFFTTYETCDHSFIAWKDETFEKKLSIIEECFKHHPLFRNRDSYALLFPNIPEYIPRQELKDSVFDRIKVLKTNEGIKIQKKELTFKEVLGLNPTKVYCVVDGYTELGIFSHWEPFSGKRKIGFTLRDGFLRHRSFILLENEDELTYHLSEDGKVLLYNPEIGYRDSDI